MNFKRSLSALLSCLVTLLAMGSVKAMDDSSSASTDSQKAVEENNEDLSWESYLILAVTFGIAFLGTKMAINAYVEPQRRRNLEQMINRFRNVQPIENDEHQPFRGEFEVSNYYHTER